MMDLYLQVLSSVTSGVVFFFSSRRRHTRFDCDWSSDVCSSDLGEVDALVLVQLPRYGVPDGADHDHADHELEREPAGHGEGGADRRVEDEEIGRASCRERV